MGLDYKEVARRIDSEAPDEFRVDAISVNLKKVNPQIPKRIYSRITDRFAYEAGSVLNENVSVNVNNSLNKKWNYSIVCENCNGKPMFDSGEERYYCPHCEQRSIFNY